MASSHIARWSCTAHVAPSTLLLQSLRNLVTSCQAQSRPFTPRTLSFDRPFSATANNNAKTRPPETRANAWDEEIRARYIRLEDDGRKGHAPIRRLADLLQTIDRKESRIVCLDNPPKSSDSSNEWTPRCKIMSRAEAYARDKAQRDNAKASKKASSGAANKIVELNWAIDTNDLAHRLPRIVEYLREGRRVEVNFAAKKRGRRADLEECKTLIEKVRETVESVRGAKVAKELQGPIGGVATIVLAGSKEDLGQVTPDIGTAGDGKDKDKT